MKIIKEWYIEAPWGKLALISWGNPRGEPVLLVHGRQDSVATFLPLLELLPDVYHYVGFDLPGHGMSDAFPIGIAIVRFLYVPAVEVVVKHLQWTNYTYVAHSMGAETGLFYNALYPGQIKKWVLIDPEPGLQHLVIEDFSIFYNYYDNYYSNYNTINVDNRAYTKSKAIKAVMKARNMNESQAEVILSRNLKEIGENQYKLSWDKRIKRMPPTNCPPEYYFELFSKNSPPTLFIVANNSFDGYPAGKDIVKKLVSDMERTAKNFQIMRVDGNHNLHFLYPERISEEVCSFLGHNFGGAKSKI